ncbi:MAG: hypothetical protein JNM88_13915 [Chitinophagaceae bacterium]|nr:hypothetical protein [Chitinophagaceae bacterium]
MSDQLKQFIDQNREAFDTDSPAPGLFKKIAQDIPGHPKHSGLHAARKWKWAAAAAIAALMILAITWWATTRQQTPPPVAKDTTPLPEEEMAGQVNPEYASQISHFRQMIGLSKNELKQLEKDNPQLYHQFVTDISELDSAYQTLKTNLPQNPNKEMLLEAMIQNLQLQSELLNRQLQIIKQIKQKGKNYES